MRFGRKHTKLEKDKQTDSLRDGGNVGDIGGDERRVWEAPASQTAARYLLYANKP